MVVDICVFFRIIKNVVMRVIYVHSLARSLFFCFLIVCTEDPLNFITDDKTGNICSLLPIVFGGMGNFLKHT